MIQFAGAYEQLAMNRWAHPMRTTIDIEDNVLEAAIASRGNQEQGKSKPSRNA